MARTKARQTIFADIGNRGAALLLDLMLLMIVGPWAADAGFKPHYLPAGCR